MVELCQYLSIEVPYMSTWHCQVTSSLQVKLFAWYSMYIVQFTVNSIYWGMKIEGHPDNATCCQDFLFLILHFFKELEREGRPAAGRTPLKTLVDSQSMERSI